MSAAAENPHPGGTLAVALAGGAGMRLGYLSSSQPRPLIPVGNRPLIWYTLRTLLDHGFYEVAVICDDSAVDSIADSLQKYFNHVDRRSASSCDRANDELHITVYPFVPTKSDFDTADVLQAIRYVWQKATNVLVVPCDLFGNFDLGALRRCHICRKADCTMLLLMPSRRTAKEKAGSQQESRSSIVGGDTEATGVCVILEAYPGYRCKQEALPDKTHAEMTHDDDDNNDDHRTFQVLCLQHEANIRTGGDGLQLKRRTFLRHHDVVVWPKLLETYIYLFTTERLTQALRKLDESEASSLKYDVVPWLVEQQERREAAETVKVLEDAQMPAEAATIPPCLGSRKCCCQGCVTLSQLHESQSSTGMIGCLVQTEADCCRVNDIGTYLNINTNILTVSKPLDFQNFAPLTFLPEANPNYRAFKKISRSVLAKDVTLDDSVAAKKSVIGPGVSLGMETRVVNSVIMAGAKLERGCSVTDCVIGRQATIGEGCQLVGCDIEADFHVPSGEKYDQEALPSCFF